MGLVGVPLRNRCGVFPQLLCQPLASVHFSTKTILMRFESSLMTFKINFKSKYSDFTDDKNEINSVVFAFP